MVSRFAAAILFAASAAAPAYAGPMDTDGTPKMLLHGNYCGPGNNAPLAPIDALDQACARHDACTPDGGLPSKACNRRLQVDAERVAQDPSQPPDLRAMAGVIASGAAMMPSDPPARSTALSVVRPVESTPADHQLDEGAEAVADDGEADSE